MFYFFAISIIDLLLLTLFIVLSVIITGAMLEQKRWIFHLEFIRFIILSVILNSFFHGNYIVIISFLLVVAIIAF